MHNAKVPPYDRCRDLIGELVAEDVRDKVLEISRPEAREEVDVSESTVRVDVPPVQPVPTYQEGGSSG